MRHQHIAASSVVHDPAPFALAERLVQRGRHAAAERALRELAAALARRRALAEASAALVRLGRLLSERGRATAAVRAFESAVQLSDHTQRPPRAVTARIWLASSMTDVCDLAGAEAVCRDLRREGPLVEMDHAWATAVLARVCLWQGRFDEARALVDEGTPRVVADETAAFVEATAVRVLLETDAVFEAGRRLDRAAATCAAPPDALAHLVLTTARVRFACATGHLTEAERALHLVRAVARRWRVPLRAVRAGLVWVEALRRAGRDEDADRELGRVRRLAPLVPPLLQDRFDRVARPRSQVIPATSSALPTPCGTSLALLVEMSRDAPSSLDALARGARWIADALKAQRVDLLAKSTPAPTSLTFAGTGPSSTLGVRALDEGRPIGPVDVGAGQEVAVPIRWDSRCVAALVCRWDRAPSDAGAWLTAAAAVLAVRVEDCVQELTQAQTQATQVPGLLGASAAMTSVRTAVVRAAPAPFAVLILGESGVGKELIARAVHALSGRRQQRLCDVNCAALPDELVESELFGYARGAFTGAMTDRVGVFEEASGGTLFLDEVVDLSLRAQAKLLRVIQQQEVRRLGESRNRPVDVRIVSAANRDPRLAVQAGGFRPDLVYRLDVIRIHVPPLRERREDVAELAGHLWRAAATGVGSRATLGRDAVTALTAYHWPGNVRELQNVLATVAVVAPREGRIGPRHLPPHVTAPTLAEKAVPLHAARLELDRRLVEAALARSAGHRGRAARELGVSRQGLLKLMCRVGMPGGDRRRGT